MSKQGRGAAAAEGAGRQARADVWDGLKLCGTSLVADGPGCLHTACTCTAGSASFGCVGLGRGGRAQRRHAAVRAPRRGAGRQLLGAQRLGLRAGRGAGTDTLSARGGCGGGGGANAHTCHLRMHALTEGQGLMWLRPTQPSVHSCRSSLPMLCGPATAASQVLKQLTPSRPRQWLAACLAGCVDVLRLCCAALCCRSTLRHVTWARSRACWASWAWELSTTRWCWQQVCVCGWHTCVRVALSPPPSPPPLLFGTDKFLFIIKVLPATAR